MKTKKTKNLTTESEMLALCSDIRLEIIRALRDGEASISEIASRLGKTPHSLYHHVKKLLDAGILCVSRTHMKGKREETLYKTSADSFRIAFEPESSKSRQALIKVAQTLGRTSINDFEKSIEQGLVVKDGPDRNSVLRRHYVRLTQKQMQEAISLLDSLERLMDLGSGNTKGQPFSLTTLFFPQTK